MIDGDPRCVRMPETRCPRCGATFDAASDEWNEHPRGPRAGDMTICVYCAAVLVFEEQLALRLFTDADLERLHPEQVIQMVIMQQRVIATTVKQRAMLN